MTAARRLVDDLLDIDYYEPTVHPSIDFRRPIRVNLSMSLYQILQVVSSLSEFSKIQFDFLGRTIAINLCKCVDGTRLV